MEDHDEGFGRNVQRLFGSGDLYEGMGGKPLAAVRLSGDKDTVIFEFRDGYKATFRVEGDCCSRSWIEHLTVPDGVAGEELVSVEDSRIEQSDTDDGYGLLQVYKTNFKTAKGDIVLEYRNESNGYYGGYLVRDRSAREESPNAE